MRNPSSFFPWSLAIALTIGILVIAWVFHQPNQPAQPNNQSVVPAESTPEQLPNTLPGGGKG